MRQVASTDIPHNMGNEQSKIIASVIVAHRKLAIAEADYNAAVRRMEKFNNE